MKSGGFIFITALIASTLLAVAAGTMLVRGTVELNTAEGIYDYTAGFHLADAGIDQAAVNLRIPGNTGSFQVTLPGGSQYWTEINEYPSGGSLTQQVTSHGLLSNYQYDIEAVFQLTPKSVFQYGMFGDQAVSLDGTVITDSYNSRDGPYDVNNPNSNGDIGTNGITAGDVALTGTVFVDGQIYVGPDVANPESVIYGYNDALVSGDPGAVSQGTLFAMPPVVVDEPAFVAVMGDGDGDCLDYTVSGSDNIILAPGDYCFHNLTVNGGGELTTSGSVTVYLTGELMVSGNTVVGVSSDPTQMVFLISSTGGAMLEGDITGNTEFYGAIYAPETIIDISGNADIYGSVIANSVTLSGHADIHFDEALMDDDSFSNMYKVSMVYWRALD